jgi:hypothetical protein
MQDLGPEINKLDDAGNNANDSQGLGHYLM